MSSVFDSQPQDSGHEDQGNAGAITMTLSLETESIIATRGILLGMLVMAFGGKIDEIYEINRMRLEFADENERDEFVRLFESGVLKCCEGTKLIKSGP